MRPSKKPLAAGLLIALFLTGQATLFAHQAEHDFKSTDSYCIACLNSSVFDRAGPTGIPIIGLHYSDEPVVFTQLITPLPAERISTEPRAPPSLS